MTEIERREMLKAVGGALAGVAGVGAIAGLSCNKRETEIRNPSRLELVKRLEQLAKSKPPTDLSFGAMCYEVAYTEIVEKPCPACEQTMIVGEKDEILREYNVPLKRIQDQNVDAKLIIPKHCSQCGFGLKEEKFQLEIKYPDQREPVKVELESAFDLQLMVFFLQGEDRFTEYHYFERRGAKVIDGGQDKPLKGKIDRLRELFGVAEKNKP
jgi:predicted Zn-ribbon and HTH transcriptional regulator